MDINFPAVKFTLRGATPLLIHNERLANPMDPTAKRLKALTSKRKKTDEDITNIARAEFDGGLYVDEDGPYIPDSWILALLRDGGKQIKLGKAITQGTLSMEDRFRLQHGLSKKPRESWEDAIWGAGYYDQRMVGNQTARILRTRPRFDAWAVTASIHYDPTVFDARQIEQILNIAGVKIGLGDYRPRFGRFTVEVH